MGCAADGPPPRRLRRCAGSRGSIDADGHPTGPDFFRFSHDGEFATLLRGAGLRGVTVETIAFGYRLASADELWNGVLGGSVRMAALIRRQPVETQDRIRAEFDRLVAEYRAPDGLEIPVSVKLAAGRNRHT